MIPTYPDGTPALDLWANCATKDCGNKACWLGKHPELCYPCNVGVQGKDAVDAEYRATFGEDWGHDS